MVGKCYYTESNIVILFSVLLSILKMFPKVADWMYVCVYNINVKLWGKKSFLEIKRWDSPYGAHIFTKRLDRENSPRKIIGSSTATATCF